MLFDDNYFTIEARSQGDFRDRGSKFIAYACPVRSEADIKSIVVDIQTANPKANHYCWAMRWTTDRSVFRLNDDGEPSGTAGRPILNTLLSRDVTNTAVIVVRYFGGTLLGVPGLINAYRTAAEMALNNATIIQKTINDVYAITFDYLQTNDVMRIIKGEAVEILEQRFDNSCSITVSIRQMEINKVISKIQKLPSAHVKYLYSV